MSDAQDKYTQLKLFATAPHPCSYLPDQEASTVFVDPSATIDREIYTYLSEKGYRRSGSFLYKPDCPNCQACISLRIPVKDYRFSRSEKRVLKRNEDLDVYTSSHIFTEKFYRLYADYICVRHSDGDMYPPSLEQYQSFLKNGFNSTEYFVFQKDEEIKAVAVVDILANGLSAIYTFYDPFDQHRSLGTLAVLWQIQQAKALELDYVYLGYWVKDCEKMRYKSRFRPAEIYFGKQWIRLK